MLAQKVAEIPARVGAVLWSDPPGPVQVIVNCHIEHFGNEGARAYQVGLGNPPNTIRRADNAWGAGTTNGAIVVAYDTTFKSAYATGFGTHTRDDSKSSTYIELNRCRLMTQSDYADAGRAMVLIAMGSQFSDLVVLNGCSFSGDFIYSSDWAVSSIGRQPADQAQVRVHGFGNGPAVFVNSSSPEAALRITSANISDTSRVEVSGTAAPIIFGEPVVKPGKGGIAGYTYGSVDVSGELAITSLGRRLGNCASANKTLSVSFQSAAPVNILFDVDYTNASNASILTKINTAIGAAGTASLYNIMALYRQVLTDEEQRLRNKTAVGIPRGSAVAYDAHQQNVRLMTSADPARAFAGVAWEDIYPGGEGRVKTLGYLPIGDMIRTDATAIVFGDTFSVDASAPGKLVKGGTQGLLMAIRPDAVKVG